MSSNNNIQVIDKQATDRNAAVICAGPAATRASSRKGKLTREHIKLIVQRRRMVALSQK